jgi:hypothetical protein
LAIAVVIGLAIWLWWPDANKLTGAAARGDLDGVRWCLRFGVDVNAPSRWGWHHENDGQTPLGFERAQPSSKPGFNPPLQRPWSSLTLGPTSLNGKVLGLKERP